jgi:hypothetical protein
MFTRSWLVAVSVLVLAGCSAGAPPAADDDAAPPPPSSESASIPCSFLSTAEVAATAAWDPGGSWQEVAVDAATCDWVNEFVDYTLTVQVLTGREASLAAITERTEDVKVAYHDTRATREDGMLVTVWVVAGADYLVMVTQGPALLEDEKFTALAGIAALAFENSPLNVG